MKAIVGAAYGHGFPDRGPLGPESFSGGEATVERLLLSLRFEVVRIVQDWTREEVELVVEDYFSMLRLESRGERYNKSELLRQVVVGYVTLQRPTIEAVIDDFNERIVPGEQKFVAALTERPNVPEWGQPPTRETMPRKMDHAGREERNRLLGCGGEDWTMRFKHGRLVVDGRPHLVERIDWLSERAGDGAGYDILSYETNGSVAVCRSKDNER